MRRAKEGRPLEELIRLSSAVCQEAERRHPRVGPGRKPEIPDWVLAVMIMVAVMHRKKSKSAQHIYWRQHQQDFQRWFPGQRLPARSTYYERYRRAATLYLHAVRLQGETAVACGWADVRCIAVDKSLIAGRGRAWSPHDRKRGHLPKRVDSDTTWGYSEHDRWVQGYAYEVVVSAPKHGVVWPLLASADTASRNEQKTFLEKVVNLPQSTEYVLADAGYDSNAVGELVEVTDPPAGRRRFLCPEVPRPNTGRACKSTSRQSRQRQWHRKLRDRRRRFFQSSRGRQLYARRKTCVEPFNAQFKRAFDLEDRVWHWGLPNNRTTILAAILAHQIILTYNHLHDRPRAHVKAILDGL